MEQIEIGQSILGFIPNLTQKRKVTEQRSALVLEKLLNYSGYYQNNEDKLQAVYTRKEHVVRLVFTDNYHVEDKVQLFSISQRMQNRKTGELFNKPKTEFLIKGKMVGKTEFEFGQYLHENFENLQQLLEYAQHENQEIKNIIAQKELKIIQSHEQYAEKKKIERQLLLEQLEASISSSVFKFVDLEKAKENVQKRRDFHRNQAKMLSGQITQKEKAMDREENTQQVTHEDTQAVGKNVEKEPIPKDPGELSKFALELVKTWSKNPEEIADYLVFMSKFPELSPRNIALVHSQWQGANAVATYDQWNGKTKDDKKNMPKVLGIKSENVDVVTRTVIDKKSGKTKTFKLDQLSVRAGESSQISLLRPIEERYFLKERMGRIQPHFEKYWSAEEKEKVNSGKIEVKKHLGFTSYKVFEISQTNIKPEFLPKVLPNRHINFEHDIKITKALEEGLEIYGQSLKTPIKIETTKAGQENILGNAHGAFYPNENKVIMNHLNTSSENVTTLVHELTHATLHQKSGATFGSDQYSRQELEAEMTAYVVASHYGIDTKEKSIPYIAQWTKNAEIFDDKELNKSLSNVQDTAKSMIKTIDANLDPELKKVQKITNQKQSQKKNTQNIAQGPGIGR